MAEKQTEQDYLMGRWRQTNYNGDDFLKSDPIGKRYGEQSYQFDPEQGTFFHPDAHLADVDPNSIQSSALRNKAIAIQKQAQLTTPGAIQASGNIRNASSATAGSGFNSPGSNPQGGATSEQNWRAFFGPKQGFDSVTRFSPVADVAQSQNDALAYANRPVDISKYQNAEVRGAQPVATLPALSPNQTAYWNVRALQGDFTRPGADRTAVLNARTDEDKRQLYAPR